MIKYSKRNMTRLAVAGAMLLLSGCYGDIKDYCEKRNDCMNGNDNDEKACVAELKGERKKYKQWGCKDQWDAYMECLVDEMDCVNDVLTDEGECNGKWEQREECREKNSKLDDVDGDIDYDPYDYYPYGYDPYDYYN